MEWNANYYVKMECSSFTFLENYFPILVSYGFAIMNSYNPIMSVLCTYAFALVFDDCLACGNVICPLVYELFY